MVVSTYYNKCNKTLMISSNNPVVKEEKKDNKVLFYNDKDEVVAINVFDYEYDGSHIVDINSIKDIEISGENQFIYATIKEIEKHPKSEKLNICQVYDGTNTHQIVCGASNVETNKVVVMAKNGAIMPNGMVIKPSKLIDVDSSGMLCSYRELGFNIEQPGIIILDDLSLVGQTFLGV